MTQQTDLSSSPITLRFEVKGDDFGNQIPVRFRVGDTELLASPGRNGSLDQHLPLIVTPFAMLGMACLRLTRQSGRAALQLDDYGNELLFQMAGDDVLIWSTMQGLTARISYETLFAAWLRFALEVRRAVTERHPDQESYEWWRLIDEDPDPFLAEVLTRRSWFDERKGCLELP